MIDGKRVLAIVPARAGSQRLPGKNVRPLAGRPLVEWTLLAGLAATTIDRLIVSTDDPAVAAIARDLDVEVVNRPAFLADASASVIDAIDHVLESLGETFDYVVLLQPTSPLRTAADIDGAVTLCDAKDAPAVIGVSSLPKPASFYGRVNAGDGYVKAEAGPDQTVVINGAVYVGRPHRLTLDRSFQTDGTLAWIMPPERGADIDTLSDFVIAEALWPAATEARPRGAGDR